jgi:recombination protein RecA
MSAFDALAKAMEKEFEKPVHEELVFLDSGFPPLNKIVSGSFTGGFANGRMFEICGDPSTGKTALATKLMVEAQKKGGVACFQDFERSFNFEFAQRLGLKTDMPYFYYAKPKTWEEANMNMAKFAKMVRESKAIPDTAPIVCVLDSVAAAPAQSTIDKGIDELSMNDSTALSRVASTTLKTIKSFMDEYKFTGIYLNQTRTKIGIVYGDPTTTPGGKAFEFYADARIFLKRKLVKDKDKNFLGQIITCEAKKTKFTKPFQETDLRLMFEDDGMGYFDIELSLIEELQTQKRIPVSGNYVVWDGKNYYPKQLAEKIRAEGKTADLIALLS